MKNTEGVPRGRGLAAPESEYPMVLLCVSVCKHSNYKVTTLITLLRAHKHTALTPKHRCSFSGIILKGHDHGNLMGRLSNGSRTVLERSCPPLNGLLQSHKR